MKANTKAVRNEVRQLIIKVGMNNITGGDFVTIAEKLGCTHCDIQNALSYYRYSPQQEGFRLCHQ